MLLFMLYYMCQLDNVHMLHASLYTSIKYIDPYNLYGSPLSCIVHALAVRVGTVRSYRLRCGAMCSSRQSKKCDVFLLNTTIDGTTDCYLCHYDVNGEYLLSQLDEDMTFLTQQFTTKCKYQNYAILKKTGHDLKIIDLAKGGGEKLFCRMT